jgi:hypothetical protein
VTNHRESILEVQLTLISCSFLLASIQLEEVLKDLYPPTIERTLETLPLTTESAYVQIKGRIEAGTHKTLALKTLCWILKAARPLEMDELCDLLATEWGSKDCQKFRSASKTILEACESFIVCQPSDSQRFVRFSHETVRNFVENEYSFTISLAAPCLAYLNFDKFAGFQTTLHSIDFPDYKALEYVTEFWIFHLRSESQIPEVQTAALKFLASKTWRDANMKYIFTKAKDLSLIHILTLNRLPELCFVAIEGSRSSENPEVFFFSSD